MQALHFVSVFGASMLSYLITYWLIKNFKGFPLNQDNSKYTNNFQYIHRSTQLSVDYKTTIIDCNHRHVGKFRVEELP